MHGSVTFRQLLHFHVALAGSNSPPEQKDDERRWKENEMKMKRNGKITGSRRVTCFTTVFGNTWSRTTQPICTLFAEWRACVLGAADT